MAGNITAAAAPRRTARSAFERRRVMGIFDVTLFTVSAMLVVETLTASAADRHEHDRLVDPGDRLLPDPLRADHGRARDRLPDAGRDLRLGQARPRTRWAARTTYWYWVNVALWMPSVFVLFAGVFFQLFDKHLAEWPAGKWWQVGMAIALVWLVIVGRRDAPRDRQVGQRPRRDPQGR